MIDQFKSFYDFEVQLIPLFIVVFTLFFVLDLLGIPYAFSKKLNIKNIYYDFHKRYGVKRTTILKVLHGCFILSYLTSETIYARRVFVFVIIYLVFLVPLFIKIIIAKKDDEIGNEKTLNRSLDSFIGFIAYPFEYLDSNKSLYPVQFNKIKWSWGAFLIPELWYFYNELLGAGYLLWSVLFLYFVTFTFVAPIPFLLQVVILPLAIRIASGLYAQQVYYAKNGKWA